MSYVISNSSKANGDIFAEFVRRHWEYFVQKAEKTCRNPDLSRDVAQDVFLDSWTKGFRGEEGRNGKVKCFLARVAFNKAVDLIRKHNRWDLREPDDLDRIKSLNASAPQERTVHQELRDTVRTTVPTRQYRLLVLRFYEGLTVDEMAQREKPPKSTVEKRLYGACKWLRESSFLEAFKPLAKGDNHWHSGL